MLKYILFFAALFVFGYSAVQSAVSPTTNTPPGLLVDPALLAERTDVIYESVQYINEPLPYVLNYTERRFHPNASWISNIYGEFSPKPIAIEYILLGRINQIVPFVPPGDNIIGAHIIPGSIKWNDTNPDVVSVFFEGTFAHQYNVSTQKYNYIIEDLVEEYVLTSAPNSPQLLSTFVDIDPVLQKIISDIIIDVEQICGLIQFRCPVGTPLQQYTSVPDCVSYLNTLLPYGPRVCPNDFTSRTNYCIVLHATSTLINADMHCPHVGRNSTVCTDRCKPSCDQCINVPDKTCVVSIPDFKTLTYNCKCADSYSEVGSSTTDSESENSNFESESSDSHSVSSGSELSVVTPTPTNSGLQCVLNTCTTTNDCHFKSGTGSCVNNQCKCNDTFVWDPSHDAWRKRDTCKCPTGTKLTKISRDVNICIPIGRCLQNKHCPQPRHTVSCVLPQANPFSKYGLCKCKPGYDGGFKFPCNPITA